MRNALILSRRYANLIRNQFMSPRRNIQQYNYHKSFTLLLESYVRQNYTNI